MCTLFRSSSESPRYVLLIIILLLCPDYSVLLAQAKGSSSEGESSSSGGLDQAFGNLITKMLQSWKFATFGMAIFGGIFALILVLVSGQAIVRYGELKRRASREMDQGKKPKDDGPGQSKNERKAVQVDEPAQNDHQIQQVDRMESGDSPNQSQVEEPKPLNPKFDKSPWNTSSAFCWLCFASSWSLLAYYPLFIVNQIHVDNQSQAPIPVGRLTILTSSTTDITVACAFLALVWRRVCVNFSGSGSSDREKNAVESRGASIFIFSLRLKMALDGAIVILMASLTITNTVLACLTSEEAHKLHGILLHVYRASYFLMTIDVIGSAFMLDRALCKAGIKDRLISWTLCACVCPLLALQAVFWLLDEIIRAAVPPQKIKQDALLTVEVGVVFVCYTWALFNGLAGFSPKSSK